MLWFDKARSESIEKATGEGTLPKGTTLKTTIWNAWTIVGIFGKDQRYIHIFLHMLSILRNVNSCDKIVKFSYSNTQK